MEDYTGRFSTKAEDYNKYRPKYPPELKDILVDDLGLRPDQLVADIGSGTGISSEVFIDLGNMVFAVEPNDEMRLMAEHNFDLEENFVSVNATAEHTGLNAQSIDLIFSGTAFHWFDVDSTKAEFERILTPNGNIMLAWNARDLNDALQSETEDIFNEFTPDDLMVETKKETENVGKFLGADMVHHTIKHYQDFGWEEYLGRLRSSSYYPNEDDEHYPIMTEKFQEIFEQHQEDGRVKFWYRCEIYHTKPE